MKKKANKKLSIKKSEKSVILFEVIERKIFILRGKKIMIDRDLAELYGVSTAALNQAVKRNIDRFPEDFIFEFSKEEKDWWRSQFVTSKEAWGGTRHIPLAFTEQGIAMLSSVLRSKRAVSVNVQIMRTFIRLREYMRDNADIRRKLELLEKKYDENFHIVFDAIKKIIQYDVDDKKKVIGFDTENKRKV
jgi:hypothetical protein